MPGIDAARPTSGERDEGLPFVTPFPTERNHYIYDVNTNRIVLVDPVLFDVVRRDDGRTSWQCFPALLSEHAPAAVEKTVQKYQHLREAHGLFSSRRSQRLQPFEMTEEVRKEYERGMHQLIIELTENCNLRCRYCSFSEYYPLNRGYSGKTISFETARKAIDYFLSRSGEGETRALSFYGGEPLLAPDLMARCIEYARAREGDLPVRFSMTTNGTLITPDVLRWLVELDTHLLVSLDGPPHCHDANRVFADGRGTAKHVLETLRMIQQAEPEYYDTHVGFASVIAPNTKPVDYFLFFEENKDLLGSGILVSNFVTNNNTDYWCRNRPPLEWSQALLAMRWKYYESLVQGELPKNRFLESLYRDNFVKIYKRPIYQHLPDTMHLNGCCRPGIRRLYVDCDGKYHMCERINNTLPIGHVDGGVDFERIRQVIDEYRAVSEEDCLNCWLIRFCPMCFATSVAEGQIGREVKLAHCDSLRRQFLQSLQDYCEIAEINPAAFNYMEDIVVK